MKDQQEQELLKGLAQSDRKAIETVYRDNYNLVQALVVNNGGTADDAKDVFQEAMVVLYEKARSAQFKLESSIRTYLYAVSRRLWLKKLALQNRMQVVADAEAIDLDVAEDVADEAEKARQHIAMEGALGQLGEPCRTLIEAFYFKKKNMGEIAALLGYTNADNAKTQKYKCLMRLKKLFFAQAKTAS